MRYGYGQRIGQIVADSHGSLILSSSIREYPLHPPNPLAIPCTPLPNLFSRRGLTFVRPAPARPYGFSIVEGILFFCSLRSPDVNSCMTIITRIARQPSSILLVLPALLYLATRTADYYWDGITFALQIEKVATSHQHTPVLFHQNHLLYSGFSYLLYTAMQTVGISIRALTVLQLVNCFVSAVALVIFFRLVLRLTGNRYAAIVSSAALAFSAIWWKLSTDANAYMLSVLFLLLCLSHLFSRKPKWYLAGLSLAAAMLFHELAALFYPAALVAVLYSSDIERKRRFAAAMSLLAWGLVIAVYYVCAALIKGITEPFGVIKWAVSNQSGVSPSGNPLPGILHLPRANVDLIVGHSLSIFLRHGGWVEWLFVLAALVTAILFIVTVRRRARLLPFIKDLLRRDRETGESWRRLAPVLMVWIGVYLLFLIFWEPWQLYYRVFYAPALALAVGLTLGQYRQPAHSRNAGAAALAVVTLAFFNLAFFIVPHMRTDANLRIVTARKATQIWNPQTVIYFSDRNEADTAFEYFNNLSEWRRLTPASRRNLDDEIQHTFRQGGSVWLNKGAAELVDADWLASRTSGKEITVDSPFAPARYIELAPPSD